jgi:hypothetical protein
MTVTTDDLRRLGVDDQGFVSPVNTPSLNKFLPASNLKPGTYLKTPDGQAAIVVGSSTPAVHDGWMWDLTVPGNNDHDFYVQAGVADILVHNCDEPYLDEPGEQHVRAGHFPGGSEVDDSKGIFNSGEDPQDLAQAGAGTEPAGPNANGFYERLVDAGRLIGNASQDSGGLPTSYYRIIHDRWGAVITMYPELPG